MIRARSSSPVSRARARSAARSTSSGCTATWWIPAAARWTCAHHAGARSTATLFFSQPVGGAPAGKEKIRVRGQDGAGDRRGSGIGAAVAARLRSDGHRVAVLDLNECDAEFSYVADVTDRVQIDTALTEIRGRTGALSPSWSTPRARTASGASPTSASTSGAGSSTSTCTGCSTPSRPCCPTWSRAGWGRIVNISSSSTHSGVPYVSAYVAAKSGVNGLTKNLALEYGPAGITVNAVPPGFIDTRCCAAPKRGNLGDVRPTSTPRRCGGWVNRRTSPPRARSSSPRRPATSPVQILGVNGGRNT